MDINTQVGSDQIVHQLRRHIFRHISLCAARENMVHINIKLRQTTVDGIDAQRIDRRVNIQYTGQLFRLFPDPALYLVQHIHAQKLIAMDTGNQRYPFLSACLFYRLQSVFLEHQLFIHRKLYGCYRLYHLYILIFYHNTMVKYFSYLYY